MGLLKQQLPTGVRRLKQLPLNGSHMTSCCFELVHRTIRGPLVFRVESNRGVARRFIQKVRGTTNDRTWIIVVNQGAPEGQIRGRLDAIIKKASHLEKRRTSEFSRLAKRKTEV